MVAWIADVHAEVVHHRRVLEPLALAVGPPVHRPRLVEEREGQPGHLPRVLRKVVAPLRELEGAAAPDVGDAVDLGDLPPVPANVVEDEALAECQVAERQLLGAQAPQDRVEEHRARDHQVGAPRIESGNREPLFEVELHDLLPKPAELLRRDTQVADFGRGALRAPPSKRPRQGSESFPMCRSPGRSPRP